MSESAEGIRLSSIEAHQAFRPERTADPKALQALSWKIATEHPALRKEAAVNPYTPSTQSRLRQLFPEAAAGDLIRAVVLAEPEAAYDQVIKALPIEQQRERQLDLSADMAVRLATHFNQYGQEFWKLTPEEIFTRLSEVAFETAEQGKVDEQYTQSQRRGFRLAIVNFIEGKSLLKPYQDQFKTTNDKQVVVEQILGEKLQETAEVEVLPVGIIISLQEKDYARMSGARDLSKIGSNGETLSEPTLPEALRGKVVIINKGGEKSGIKTAEQIESTKRHELRHVLYGTFFAHKASVRDIKKRLIGITDQGEHQVVAQDLRDRIIRLAQDEVIAHSSTGKEHVELSDLGSDTWDVYLKQIQVYLWCQEGMSLGEKQKTYELYREQVVSAAEAIRRYQWIVKNLFAVTGEERGLTKEKAEALLQLTPLEKAGRLARYFDLPMESVEQGFLDEEKAFARGLLEETQDLMANGGGLPYDRYIEALNYPQASIPALLKVFAQPENGRLVSNCMFTMRDILLTNKHALDKDTLEEIGRSLETLKSMQPERAVDIQQMLELVASTRVDFVHHKPFLADMAEVMKKINGVHPTYQQVLDSEESIRNNTLSLPIMVELLRTTNDHNGVRSLLISLHEMKEHFDDDEKRQVGEVLNEVLSKDYEGEPVFLKRFAAEIQTYVLGKIEN